MPSPSPDLRVLLDPLIERHFPGPHGWAKLGRRLGRSRHAVYEWRRAGRVPATCVDAVCDVLGADEETRAVLRRRAGIQVVDEVGD